MAASLIYLSTIICENTEWNSWNYTHVSSNINGFSFSKKIARNKNFISDHFTKFPRNTYVVEPISQQLIILQRS